MHSNWKQWYNRSNVATWKLSIGMNERKENNKRTKKYEKKANERNEIMYTQKIKNEIMRIVKIDWHCVNLFPSILTAFPLLYVFPSFQVHLYHWLHGIVYHWATTTTIFFIFFILLLSHDNVLLAFHSTLLHIHFTLVYV